MRAERLGAADGVRILAETDLEVVVETIAAELPDVCVIDSVQTLHAADVGSGAGSVAQVREAADRLLRLAKSRGVADRPRRPRDQGRDGRRPARARAPGRRRAPVRGRPLPAPARAAGGQEPLRLHRRDRDLRDDGRGPRPGRRPVVGARRGRRGRAGFGAPAGDRGQPPDPARGAGARGPLRPGDAAPPGDRLRPQPPQHDRRGARAARRHRARLVGRVRERGRRRARRRAGGRPGRRARDRLVAPRPAGRRAAGVLRRDRADRPPAARRPHRSAARRGRQAGRHRGRRARRHRRGPGSLTVRCADTLDAAIGLALA